MMFQYFIFLSKTKEHYYVSKFNSLSLRFVKLKNMKKKIQKNKKPTQVESLKR